MNIVILGAGQVGSELSAILASDHDVTLIDLNQEKLQKISDHHDLKTICGNACYPKTLEQAEIEKSDLAIAMTQYDEVNMVACQMIKHISKRTKTMARIRATQYLGGKGSEIFEAGDYTIDVIISPENLITDFIKRIIEVPGANKVLDFLDLVFENRYAMRYSINIPHHCSQLQHQSDFFQQASLEYE